MREPCLSDFSGTASRQTDRHTEKGIGRLAASQKDRQTE